MLDIVTKNGFIVDGSGSPGFFGTIGIKQRMIEHVLVNGSIAYGKGSPVNLHAGEVLNR
jgi:N-acyl-D-aspartate/D-glutamate deacylase